MFVYVTHYQRKGLAREEWGIYPQVSYNHIKLTQGKRIAADGHIYYKGKGIRGVVSDPAKIRELWKDRRYTNATNKLKALHPGMSEKDIKWTLDTGIKNYEALAKYDKKAAGLMFSQLMS